MKEKEYRELRNQYEQDFSRKIKEWNGLYLSHLVLNQRLDEMFKNFNENKDVTPSELVKYLETRTDNDKINSEFKIISTETNAIWIKIQELDKRVVIENEVSPIFIGVDKENGRLRYYLDFIK